jgi:hypothetical protein
MIMERGMRLMGDPRVMKLMSNPKVMNVAMQAFQLRSKAQASLDEKRKAFASLFKLATREDLSELRSTLRSIEQSLIQLQQQGQGQGQGKKNGGSKV